MATLLDGICINDRIQTEEIVAFLKKIDLAVCLIRNDGHKVLLPCRKSLSLRILSSLKLEVLGVMRVVKINRLPLGRCLALL